MPTTHLPKDTYNTCVMYVQIFEAKPRVGFSGDAGYWKSGQVYAYAYRPQTHVVGIFWWVLCIRRLALELCVVKI